MTIQDVKQIKLADYLQSLGYTPVKQQGRNLCGKPLSQSAEPIKEKKQVQSARRMMQPPKKKGGFHL